MYNFTRKDKFDPRWMSGYHIIKRTGPVSFVVKHEESGKTHRVHVDALRHDKRPEESRGPGEKGESHPEGRDQESLLGPKKSPTDAESDSSGEDRRSDSQSEDSDNTEIYDYDSDATEIYEYQPESSSRPKRTAKEEAKLKMKYCHKIKEKGPLEDKLSKIFHMLADQLKTEHE
jgi:hypothetical protein